MSILNLKAHLFNSTTCEKCNNAIAGNEIGFDDSKASACKHDIAISIPIIYSCRKCKFYHPYKAMNNPIKCETCRIEKELKESTEAAKKANKQKPTLYYDKKNKIYVNTAAFYELNLNKIDIFEFKIMNEKCNGHYFYDSCCDAVCVDCCKSSCSCGGIYHCCCNKSTTSMSDSFVDTDDEENVDEGNVDKGNINIDNDIEEIEVKIEK